MGKITVKFVCGCKFSTESMIEAVAHSDRTGHSLMATGMILGSKRKEGQQSR